MAPKQTLPEFLVSRCKADISGLYESLRLVERHKALQALQTDDQCVNALPYLVSTLSNLQGVIGASKKGASPSFEEVTTALRGQEGDRRATSGDTLSRMLTLVHRRHQHSHQWQKSKK